jgi:hypothetical protein
VWLKCRILAWSLEFNPQYTRKKKKEEKKRKSTVKTKFIYCFRQGKTEYWHNEKTNSVIQRTHWKSHPEGREKGQKKKYQKSKKVFYIGKRLDNGEKGEWWLQKTEQENALHSIIRKWGTQNNQTYDDKIFNEFKTNQAQWLKRLTDKISQERPLFRHIIMNFLNVNYKEKILLGSNKKQSKQLL